MFALVLAGALMTVAPASAHHSFAATCFEDKTVTIDGQLVQFMFRNPHSFVHVEAPGDHVVIIGNPGRNPEDHQVRMRSIKRPSDGFGWSGVVQ